MSKKTFLAKGDHGRFGQGVYTHCSAWFIIIFSLYLSVSISLTVDCLDYIDCLEMYQYQYYCLNYLEVGCLKCLEYIYTLSLYKFLKSQSSLDLIFVGYIIAYLDWCPWASDSWFIHSFRFLVRHSQPLDQIPASLFRSAFCMTSLISRLDQQPSDQL